VRETKIFEEGRQDESLANAYETGEKGKKEIS
jgi:hypothetical protein